MVWYDNSRPIHLIPLENFLKPVNKFGLNGYFSINCWKETLAFDSRRILYPDCQGKALKFGSNIYHSQERGVMQSWATLYFLKHVWSEFVLCFGNRVYLILCYLSLIKIWPFEVFRYVNMIYECTSLIEDKTRLKIGYEREREREREREIPNANTNISASGCW